MMTSCRCKACSEDPLESFGESYRHACELRHVLALPSRADRIRYLSGVNLERGLEAYARIVEELREIASRRAA